MVAHVALRGALQRLIVPRVVGAVAERRIDEAPARLARPDLGVEAGTVEGRTGVWAGNAKVCAFGVRVAGGVSLHGLALNVAPDLASFDAIVPCGIRDAGVTSLERLLGRAPPMEVVFDRVEAAFLRAAPGGVRARKRRA